MNIIIEGWRNINHSYALVNQWQINELLKSTNITFKDVPFRKNWNSKKNNSGLRDEIKDAINKIQSPSNLTDYDITYRISFPFNFDKNFNSKAIFIFVTAEYKGLVDKYYVNGDPIKLTEQENFFIHTPSNWSKNIFLDAGFKDHKITVIPHGIDINTFYPISDEKKKNVRNYYKIKSDDFVLTNISSMSQNKGVEDLIAAYGILKKKNKNLKLILKDQSNLYNLNASSPVKNMIDSKFNQKYKIFNEQVLKDIIIISKNLNFKELRELYSITDCYVSPYKAESFNLPPLEAAACGTQIVVTNGGPTDDYVDLCMGFKIESKEQKLNNHTYLQPNINSLIEILNSIINKNDDKKKVRSELVQKNFSWEIVVKKLKSAFKNNLDN